MRCLMMRRPTGGMPWVLGLAMFAAMATAAQAGEPAPRNLIPSDAVLTVEITRPLSVLNSRLGQDLWSILKASAEVEKRLASPAAGRIVEAARFVESSLGAGWREGFDALTAGGVLFAVRAGAEPTVYLVVTSDREETLRRFVDAAQKMIRSRAEQAGAAGRGALIASTYRDHTCHQVGDAHYAVAGRRLLYSNRRSGLESLLDRLAGDAKSAPFNPPADLESADAPGSPPLVRVVAHLKVLREDPNAQKRLALPSDNPGLIALLGGYVDLLRRADFAAATLSLKDAAVELHVRATAGSAGMVPSLRPFFATDSDAMAAPLLQPAGALYSASWFRDYSALWNARSELVTAERVKVLDDENAKQVQAGQIGVANLVKSLGPHLRVVAAPQREEVYRLPLAERLPAAALVVDVRNEQGFREQVLTQFEKFARSPIALFLGTIRSTSYKNATLVGLKLRDDDKTAGTGSKLRYSANPAYTLTRGHFIVGSTEEIVRTVIDELDRLAAAPPVAAGASHVTDMQQLSFAQLGDEIKSLRDRFVRNAVLNQGLSVSEADCEVEIFRRVLARLGRLTTRTTLTADEFEFRLRIGE